MMGPLLLLAAAVGAAPNVSSVNQLGGVTTSRVGDMTITTVMRQAAEKCRGDIRECAIRRNYPELLPQPWERYSTESNDYQALRAFEVAKQYCRALINPPEGYTMRDMIDKFRDEYLGLSEKAWLEKFCIVYKLGVEAGSEP